MIAKKWVSSPYTSLVFNVVCALAHSAVGIVTRSWWFITLGAYYTVLTVARFSVLQVRRHSGGDTELELFAKKITGILLIFLSVCLIGIITLSAIEGRGTAHHEIVMIAVATYTFTKMTFAIIGLVKTKRSPSPVAKTLRAVSLANALAAIYSLQRSMLVSFPGMTEPDIRLFNILTGTAVWLLILLLGVNLLGGRYINMAKSKLIQANEKIADAVVSGYKKIEKGVVDGYKKIEDGVVSGYTKLEDKFVDAYLTKDGETVEQAKARLKSKSDAE